MQTARTEVVAQAQALARQHGGRILHVYENAVRDFAASMSATAAAAIARNPRVRYVEQDSVMTIVASQPNATWGLDRIDLKGLTPPRTRAARWGQGQSDRAPAE